MCVQRLLGRDVYQDKEKLAWSIVLATKGLQGFIETLLSSEEYMENFGYDTVPYQRRGILPQRESGELPFERMPRYGDAYRNVLKTMGYFRADAQPAQISKTSSKYSAPIEAWDWQESESAFAIRAIGAVIGTGGGLLVTAFLVIIALSAWGVINL